MTSAARRPRASRGRAPPGPAAPRAPPTRARPARRRPRAGGRPHRSAPARRPPPAGRRSPPRRAASPAGPRPCRRRGRPIPTARARARRPTSARSASASGPICRPSDSRRPTAAVRSFSTATSSFAAASCAPGQRPLGLFCARRASSTFCCDGSAASAVAGAGCSVEPQTGQRTPRASPRGWRPGPRPNWCGRGRGPAAPRRGAAARRRARSVDRFAAASASMRSRLDRRELEPAVEPPAPPSARRDRRQFGVGRLDGQKFGVGRRDERAAGGEGRLGGGAGAGGVGGGTAGGVGGAAGGVELAHLCSQPLEVRPACRAASRSARARPAPPWRRRPSPWRPSPFRGRPSRRRACAGALGLGAEALDDRLGLDEPRPPCTRGRGRRASARTPGVAPAVAQRRRRRVALAQPGVGLAGGGQRVLRGRQRARSGSAAASVAARSASSVTRRSTSASGVSAAGAAQRLAAVPGRLALRLLQRQGRVLQRAFDPA